MLGMTSRSSSQGIVDSGGVREVELGLQTLAVLDHTGQEDGQWRPRTRNLLREREPHSMSSRRSPSHRPSPSDSAMPEVDSPMREVLTVRAVPGYLKTDDMGVYWPKKAKCPLWLCRSDRDDS